MKDYLFTSESVTEGHPDKVCDQISDAILDEVLSQDPNGRVACETLITTNLVVVTGEITTIARVDIENIVRKVLREIGYTSEKRGIDYKTCEIIVKLDKQSPDIALGVDKSIEIKNGIETDVFDIAGAGDQGMMFGYACDETEELMPLAISLAHKLTKKLTEVRKSRDIDYLYPDGKAQVTVEYKNNVPFRIDTIIVSSQHKSNIEIDRLRNDIKNKVVFPVIPQNMIDENTKILINPTGRFVVGGPKADSGLTGRKIIVDTYGGYSKHGGGAFSGKDPSKVDRSASYFCRYVAKNIVASGMADKCEIQVSYAIGLANPISVSINTFGTCKISDEELYELVKNKFDFRPAAIINKFNLKRPIYRQTASYGHFGRNDLNLPWENCDANLKIRY